MLDNCMSMTHNQYAAPEGRHLGCAITRQQTSPALGYQQCLDYHHQ